YQAIHFDPKRASFLLKQIQAHAERAGIIADEQIDLKNQFGLLSALDRYVCEVKERQIRHGLHVIGQELTQIKIANFLLSVGRLPRRQGHGSDASIIHAIADDLGLLSDHFDPMKPDYAENWLGKKPIILQQISSETWRNVGDTIERLELLAMHILAGEQKIMPGWHKTKAVVDQLNSDILPKLCMSPEQEINFLLAGLDGFFVPPGPSGAPTRGRVDVLP
ncbi:MAG TPA: cobaltochelatase subunit CobN, partial [Alphaproteobacteria bacterium]|nr:cobaltochelatase subunit CobN [Alphaproteobacteria bacterium]